MLPSRYVSSQLSAVVLHSEALTGQLLPTNEIHYPPPLPFHRVTRAQRGKIAWLLSLQVLRNFFLSEPTPTGKSTQA